MVWVACQLLLMLLIFFGPGTPQVPGASLLKYPGAFLTLAGVTVMVAALGPLHRSGSLTPLPAPRAEGRLANRGLYAVMRHPLYSGVLLASFGASLLIGGWINLAAWAVLAALLDRKASLEERLLATVHPEYETYRRRVPKFLPRLGPFVTVGTLCREILQDWRKRRAPSRRQTGAKR